MKRFFAFTVFLGVLVGTLALSKAEDLNLLMNAGRKAREQFSRVMPEARKLAGPLAAFRAGDALPVEERVRVRIQTDQAMVGADVSVVSSLNSGEICLRGLVKDREQKRRANELARATIGVEQVRDELAVPEGQ